MTVPAPILFPPQPRHPAIGTAEKWIDVSNHQEVLTEAWFSHWAGLGYGGLVVQGVMNVHGESFTQRQLWAGQNAGWQIAGYVWLNAGQADRLEFLQNRLNFFEGYKLNFLALDVEEPKTSREDIDAGLALCDQYQKAPAWIYTARWVFQMLRFSQHQWWRDRKLWAAQYDGIPDVNVFQGFGGWNQCEMKQFTGSPLDLNVRRV